MEKEQPPRVVAVDTGVIYALADRSDSWHNKCVRFVANYRGRMVISCGVIPESCYLLNSYLGPEAEAAFVRSVGRGELICDHFANEDFGSCRALLDKYNDLNLGFVDAMVIAMCERRKISAILTTDRKHFSVVRTRTGNPFQLLP